MSSLHCDKAIAVGENISVFHDHLHNTFAIDR